MQASLVADDLPELEDLLTTKPNSTQPDLSDDFADLDELLAESKAHARDAKAGENLRDKLKRGGMSGEEKAETERQLREWEARREWKHTGNAVLFNQYVCTCGSKRSVFGGWFQRQVHRHMSHATRLIAATQPQSTCPLPREVVYQTLSVPVCEDCLDLEVWL